MIVLGLYLLALCVLGFAARRRVGLLGLALAVGAVLAELWASALVPVAAKAGLVVAPGLIAIALTLLPALLVLGRGVKVRSHIDALIAGLVFALLAVMLTYESFTSLVVMDAASQGIVAAIVPYKSLTVTICLVYALFDVMAKHSHKGHDSKRSHK